MIEVTFRGKTCLFDDSQVDREHPGHVYHYLLANQFYEHKFLVYIRSLGLRGAYLDVGAYIGTHTLFFAVLCGAEHVYSFEPRQPIFDTLQRNVALNGIGDRVTLFPIGLSDAPGSVTVELDRRSWTFPVDTLDRVLRSPLLEDPTPEHSPLRRLVDRLTDRRRRAVVLKIDVEGMESQVLKGASALLTDHRPRVFAEAHTEDAFDSLREHLAPFGYRPSGRVFNASPTYEFVAK